MNKDKKYRRTPQGVINSIMCSQRYCAKKRGHHPPNYTIGELRQWCFSQKKFWDLYTAWWASGYDSQCKPSIDRMNNKKSYTFDNLQLMTFRENEAKGGREETNHTVKMKPVCQYDENGVFVKEWRSQVDASKHIGVRRSSINHAVTLKRRSGGYYWRFPIVSRFSLVNKELLGALQGLMTVIPRKDDIKQNHKNFIKGVEYVRNIIEREIKQAISNIEKDG